jgi:hypothetical protein
MVVDALNILEDFSITQLVVVDHDEYKGVLHLHDILRRNSIMAKKIKTKCRFRSPEDLRWLLVRSTPSNYGFYLRTSSACFDTIIFWSINIIIKLAHENI